MTYIYRGEFVIKNPSTKNVIDLAGNNIVSCWNDNKGDNQKWMGYRIHDINTNVQKGWHDFWIFKNFKSQDMFLAADRSSNSLVASTTPFVWNLKLGTYDNKLTTFWDLNTYKYASATETIGGTIMLSDISTSKEVWRLE